MVERLAIHFRKSFGQAEHRNRLDRLVGRDHHHRFGARRQRGIGDIDRSEDVGLDALAPVALEDRHVLQRRGVEHDVGLEFAHQPHDARTIADIRDPALDDDAGSALRQCLGDGIERRFRMFDHQHSRRAEGRNALADLGPDRTAAAGHDDGLALHQRFQPCIVDLLAGTQQQILDRDIRQPRRVAALHRGHPADDQPEPLRTHQHRFGMRVRLECRRRHHRALDRLFTVLEIADHGLDVVGPAEHRNVADRLAAIGRRRRQHADRPDPLDGAVLDPAQHDFRIGRTSDQQRRRRIVGTRLMTGPRVPKIAVAEAQRAEEEHLEKKVEDDGDAAEEHGVVSFRRNKDGGVIQHHQRNRQHCRDAQDVERIGQRDETPFGGSQIEEIADHHAEGDEPGQNAQQQRQAVGEKIALEPQIETRQQRSSGHQRVV